MQICDFRRRFLAGPCWAPLTPATSVHKHDTNRGLPWCGTMMALGGLYGMAWLGAWWVGGCTTSHSMAETGFPAGTGTEHKQTYIVQQNSHIGKIGRCGNKRNSTVQNFDSLALFRCFNTLIVAGLEKWVIPTFAWLLYLYSKPIYSSLCTLQVAQSETALYSSTLQLGLDKFRSATSF